MTDIPTLVQVGKPITLMYEAAYHPFPTVRPLIRAQSCGDQGGSP